MMVVIDENKYKYCQYNLIISDLKKWILPNTSDSYFVARSKLGCKYIQINNTYIMVDI